MRVNGRKLFILWIVISLLAGCGAEYHAKTVPEEPMTGKDASVPGAKELNAGSVTAGQTADAGETSGADSSGLRSQDIDTEGKSRTDSEQEDGIESLVQQYLNSMSLEDKAAQLFVVIPEQLMTDVSVVTAAGNMTKEAFNEVPVGGFTYMAQNLQSEDQVKSMLANVQAYSMERIGLPAFLCVDEEGGSVARISGTGRFQVPDIEDMADVGQKGDVDYAGSLGAEMGAYLSEMGFNVDFAPVADVLTNPENQVVRRRSFGEDPQLVAAMTEAVASGLEEKGILAVYKHFPGHGATAADTHQGYAYTDKTLDELKKCELIPFQAGIEQGIPFIMVGHISLPAVTGEDVPASLSFDIMTKLLREEMGYDGIVITDALNMGAITRQYSSSEAAVKALMAGADILLMPQNLREAYRGVIDAVKSGEVPMERIDEALSRVLRVKLQLMDRMES